MLRSSGIASIEGESDWRMGETLERRTVVRATSREKKDIARERRSAEKRADTFVSRKNAFPLYTRTAQGHKRPQSH